MALPDDIRAACARVAASARSVRVVDDAVAAYAATLPAASPPAPDLAPGAADEERAAFSLQLNAVNFGSGWFPTLRKPPGLSGFRTVEAGLRARGPWTAAELRRLDAGAVATAFGQDPGHELMALFATALRELGAVVGDGSFLALARSGDGSAVALAERLAAIPTWADRSPYDGAVVPFFKRAQLAAADLHLQGLAPAADLGAADAVRRQPRPARAADRRRARLRPGAGRADRPRGAARARLARGGRDPRLRASTPSSCSSRRTAPRPRRRSTTRSGTAAPRRATRRTRATARAPRRTDRG